MAFFGSLIKKGIELNRVFKGDEKPARYLQEEQLKILLRSARNTAFGKFYGFENILRSDDLLATFQHEVPIFDYNRLHEQWWHKQQELPDITWPGKPNYF